MSEKNIVFANIVSTPTLNSWAQAYNAGKLFAVLALKGEVEKGKEEEQGLNAIGKTVLNSLEQEFFTLETKDLNSIKTAVEATVKKIPEGIEGSFIVCAIVNNIAYLFVLNKGKVNLKRETKLGTIVDGGSDQEGLKAASGFLKDNDIIILQTAQFTDLVSEDRLSSSLDHLPPSEISESLAPFVHEAQEGGAACVIIEYKEEKGIFEEEVLEENKEEEKEEEETPKNSFFYTLKEKVKLPSLNGNHSKKLFLTIALIIFVVLVSGIFLAYKNQQDNKVKAVFSQYYPEAQKKYEEGQALIDLNQNLARDNFLASEKLLKEAKDRLPKDSSEQKQVLDLLSKVTTAVSDTSGVNNIDAKEVGADETSLLAFEKNHTGDYFFEAERNVYYADSKGINLSDGTTSKVIIKNDNTWEKTGGLGVYFGNIYVLDKMSGILKFVSDSYAKSDYFSDTAPDLTKASAITIDGSIWVLFSDGNISKFTKGKAENFSISGLDKKLSSPTRIYTNLDSESLYVLDNGNSRIVVLNKDGNYSAQYQAGILKGAKDFDVQETNKKIFVLSGGKIYKIELK